MKEEAWDIPWQAVFKDGTVVYFIIRYYWNWKKS